MAGTGDSITGYLTADHEHLAELLARAEGRPLDLEAYGEFRRRLLRHIAMEEKILLPAAARARGEPLPVAARLRADHGALAALLVPSPTHAIVNAIRTILAGHNLLEESHDGVYASVERLAGSEASALLAQLRAAPAVPVSPYNDGPRTIPAAQRALTRAGYDPALIDPPAATEPAAAAPPPRADSRSRRAD
ncbi:MAG TPA: hemerythrin domain-containing protein [Candidatus Binatia bacterium]